MRNREKPRIIWCSCGVKLKLQRGRWWTRKNEKLYILLSWVGFTLWMTSIHRWVLSMRVTCSEVHRKILLAELRGAIPSAGRPSQRLWGSSKRDITRAWTRGAYGTQEIFRMWNWLWPNKCSPEWEGGIRQGQIQVFVLVWKNSLRVTSISILLVQSENWNSHATNCSPTLGKSDTINILNQQLIENFVRAERHKAVLISTDSELPLTQRG